MRISTDTSRGALLGRLRSDENVVQERPTLGALRPRERGARWWLLPAVDFAASSLALIVVTRLAGAPLLPAFPLAPLLLVGVYGLLHGYKTHPRAASRPGESQAGWLVIQLLIGALFAFVASLIADLGTASELALWGTVALLGTVSRRASGRLMRQVYAPERWLLVGDGETADLLARYEPLRAYATVVGHVEPHEAGPGSATRLAALEAVERHAADRVVIASRHGEESGLVDLVQRVQIDRRAGQPAAAAPRPAGGPVGDGGRRRRGAADRSRGAGDPPREPLRRARPARRPHDPGQRRRPGMNEEANIGHVLERLPAGMHEVILVDGNSEDGTIEAARRACPDIRVLTQSGRGKGDAFRTGFAAATGNLVVMLDADGSADPAEIPRFVEALEAGADFAKGSRFLPGGGSADMTPLRRLGNTILSGTANLLHGTRFTDLCYGYNAFWARCLPFISLDVPGFEVETLINLRVAGAGMKITEVPSYEENRLSGQSNLNTFRDGFRVLRTIVARGAPPPGDPPRAPPVRRAEHPGGAEGGVGDARGGGGDRRWSAPTTSVAGTTSPPAWARSSARPRRRWRRSSSSTTTRRCWRGPSAPSPRRWRSPAPPARAGRGRATAGIAAASGELVAFIDDDARAEPRWLERLAACFERPEVVGAGGALLPLWEGPEPRWLPPEFYWVVGCSYAGLPAERAPVRNPIGANMAVRASALAGAGGFREGAGADAPRELRERGVVRAAGNVPDDTDLAIRVSRLHPGAVWLYEPAARVLHRVGRERATLGYFLRRSCEEGVGKAGLARYAGAGEGLSAERRQLARVLPRGLAGDLRALLGGDPSGGLRALALLAGVLSTGTGFLLATLGGALRRGSAGG